MIFEAELDIKLCLATPEDMGSAGSKVGLLHVSQPLHTLHQLCKDAAAFSVAMGAWASGSHWQQVATKGTITVLIASMSGTCPYPIRHSAICRR